MTISSGALQEHIDYTIWASRRLLDAASVLSPEELSRDFGTADRTILGTLAHLYNSEKIWLARLREGRNAVQQRRAEDVRLEFVRENWAETHENWKNWASQLPPDAPDQVIEYLDLKNQPWAHPVWQILLHVVNHSTHHRGQISGFLRALGKTPPPLDYMAFIRENAS